MRIRHEEDRPTESAGDVLTLEREESPDVRPFSETEPEGKPLVAFEAYPAKAVPPRW